MMNQHRPMIKEIVCCKSVPGKKHHRQDTQYPVRTDQSPLSIVRRVMGIIHRVIVHHRVVRGSTAVKQLTTLLVFVSIPPGFQLGIKNVYIAPKTHLLAQCFLKP